MYQKSHLILFTIIFLCVSFFIISLYQFGVIISKKIALKNAEHNLTNVTEELNSARETLYKVSSSEYHDLYARKKGYATANERSYVAS